MKTFYSSFMMVTLLLLSHLTFADDDKFLKFKVGLSGAQEVSPPAPVNGVDTMTTGNLKIFFNNSLSKAEYRLLMHDGVGITQAHLHCGRAGENGPVVAFLFGLEVDGVNVNGMLVRATLTNEDITDVGSDCSGSIGRPVNNIASLAAAALDGLIYVNVHSLSNPAGEVRGQLLKD